MNHKKGDQSVLVIAAAWVRTKRCLRCNLAASENGQGFIAIGGSPAYTIQTERSSNFGRRMLSCAEDRPVHAAFLLRPCRVESV